MTAARDMTWAEARAFYRPLFLSYFLIMRTDTAGATYPVGDGAYSREAGQAVVVWRYVEDPRIEPIDLSAHAGNVLWLDPWIGTTLLFTQKVGETLEEIVEHGTERDPG